MKNIATALVKAQKEFGPALKSSTNPHFKSRYADLSACIEAVIDGLNNNGIFLTQKLMSNDAGVNVQTVLLHESGEMLECGDIFIPANKHDAQGFGSALTYARRYSLMSACGIAPEDDDGNAAVRKTTVNESVMIDHITNIKSVSNVNDLQIAYKDAYQAAQGDAVWQKKIIATKDEMKAKFK